jgi:glycosyltransferase involved in cell wall biosynthesis
VGAPLISVVVPVHNEASHVVSMAEDLMSGLRGVGAAFELVLVPNACRDNTEEICRALGHADPAVKVAAIERGGWGVAVKHGLAHASGDILCYTNGARTGGRDLAIIVARALANPDSVVKATRILRENWSRRMGSLLYNVECRLLFHLPFGDVNGTPKAFPRKYAPLLNLTRDDDLIDVEFSRIVASERYPMLEVPIVSTNRRSGKSTTNYSSAFKMYLGALQMAWSAHDSPSNR